MREIRDKISVETYNMSFEQFEIYMEKRLDKVLLNS